MPNTPQSFDAGRRSGPSSRTLKELDQLTEESQDFWENVWLMLAQSAREGNVNSTTRKGKGKQRETKGELASADLKMRGSGSRSQSSGGTEASASVAIAEARTVVDDLFGSGKAKMGKQKDFAEKGLIRAVEIV